VKDKEGNCEPDGFLRVIDAMGAKEFYVEVKDFKKHQIGITNARRKADI
jgi:hypothetical protein